MAYRRENQTVFYGRHKSTMAPPMHNNRVYQDNNSTYRFSECRELTLEVSAISLVLPMS